MPNYKVSIIVKESYEFILDASSEDVAKERVKEIVDVYDPSYFLYELKELQINSVISKGIESSVTGISNLALELDSDPMWYPGGSPWDEKEEK